MKTETLIQRQEVDFADSPVSPYRGDRFYTRLNEYAPKELVDILNILGSSHSNGNLWEAYHAWKPNGTASSYERKASIAEEIEKERRLEIGKLSTDLKLLESADQEYVLKGAYSESQAQEARVKAANLKYMSRRYETLREDYEVISKEKGKIGRRIKIQKGEDVSGYTYLTQEEERRYNFLRISTHQNSSKIEVIENEIYQRKNYVSGLRFWIDRKERREKKYVLREKERTTKDLKRTQDRFLEELDQIECKMSERKEAVEGYSTKYAAVEVEGRYKIVRARRKKTRDLAETYETLNNMTSHLEENLDRSEKGMRIWAPIQGDPVDASLELASREEMKAREIEENVRNAPAALAKLEKLLSEFNDTYGFNARNSSEAKKQTEHRMKNLALESKKANILMRQYKAESENEIRREVLQELKALKMKIKENDNHYDYQQNPSEDPTPAKPKRHRIGFFGKSAPYTLGVGATLLGSYALRGLNTGDWNPANGLVDAYHSIAGFLSTRQAPDILYTANPSVGTVLEPSTKTAIYAGFGVAAAEVIRRKTHPKRSFKRLSRPFIHLKHDAVPPGTVLVPPEYITANSNHMKKSRTLKVMSSDGSVRSFAPVPEEKLFGTDKIVTSSNLGDAVMMAPSSPYEPMFTTKLPPRRKWPAHQSLPERVLENGVSGPTETKKEETI